MKKQLLRKKRPYQTEVEEGKTYYWCACGLSKKQPYCDGSHKDTSFSTRCLLQQIRQEVCTYVVVSKQVMNLTVMAHIKIC